MMRTMFITMILWRISAFGAIIFTNFMVSRCAPFSHDWNYLEFIKSNINEPQMYIIQAKCVLAWVNLGNLLMHTCNNDTINNTSMDMNWIVYLVVLIHVYSITFKLIIYQRNKDR